MEILQVYLLDDRKELTGAEWKVICKVYNKELSVMESKEWLGRDTVGFVKKIGEVEIAGIVAASNSLFVTVELQKMVSELEKPFIG